METDSNNFEDYESENVEMEQPCSCGNQIFKMEVRYSDKPAHPDFNKTIDRRFTCIKCKKSFILEDTYPISCSF